MARLAKPRVVLVDSREEASVSVQKIWRGKMARGRRKDSLLASLQIQSLWRGRAARQTVLAKMSESRSKSGRLVKRGLRMGPSPVGTAHGHANKFAENALHAAAVTLQANTRRLLARRFTAQQLAKMPKAAARGTMAAVNWSAATAARGTVAVGKAVINAPHNAMDAAKRAVYSSLQRMLERQLHKFYVNSLKRDITASLESA